MVEQIIHLYLTASTLDFYRLSGWVAGEGLSERKPALNFRSVSGSANDVHECRKTRVVHASNGPAGRVGMGRVTILRNFDGSGQHFGCFSLFLIISWFLNRYESSKTIFGLIVFLRYLKSYND